MNESCEMLMTAIPTDQGSFVLVHPCKQTLDFPSTPVAPEWATILSCRTDTVLSVRRNQLDSLGCQLLIERITVVGTMIPTIRRGRPMVTASASVASARVTSCGEAEAVCTASGRSVASATTMSFVPLPRLVFPTLAPLFCHREGAVDEANGPLFVCQSFVSAHPPEVNILPSL